MKRPFIIDCDTGTDDAIAILAACYSDQVDLKGITSVNGNVAEMYTSRNNLDLMEHIGKKVPVTHGAVRPLCDRGYNASEDSTHGACGLGNLTLPAAKETDFDSRRAPEFIHDIAVECKGELELLVIGPETNIAMALLLYPDLKQLIKHIWIMGGAVRGGNCTPTAEFNIWIDPEAARVVFRSGIPMTMVGLDVTEKACMLPEDCAELRECGTHAAVFAADLLEYMFTRNYKGGEAALMHDALALGAALCPECLTCKDFFVDVECDGTYSYGHTFVDARKRTGKPANMSVAMEVDVPVFRRWLVDTIKNSARKEG